jgi:hypothetical protein
MPRPRSLGTQAAEALADPAAYPNLFPQLDEALEAEKLLGGCRPAVCRQLMDTLHTS